MKKIIIASIASLMFVTGIAFAAGPKAKVTADDNFVCLDFQAPIVARIRYTDPTTHDLIKKSAVGSHANALPSYDDLQHFDFRLLITVIL